MEIIIASLYRSLLFKAIDIFKEESSNCGVPFASNNYLLNVKKADEFYQSQIGILNEKAD